MNSRMKQNKRFFSFAVRSYATIRGRDMNVQISCDLYDGGFVGVKVMGMIMGGDWEYVLQ